MGKKGIVLFDSAYDITQVHYAHEYVSLSYHPTPLPSHLIWILHTFEANWFSSMISFLHIVKKSNKKENLPIDGFPCKLQLLYITVFIYLCISASNWFLMYFLYK